ncbi:MAG: NADP-dependent isocitrate dehydrogenase [Alphaproteobacteria bacterium GM202ARS2]|nr:NADP-dependent isocitrate dehydrogenase [Alphaproteobacteria bacterium GM202ARS2]
MTPKISVTKPIVVLNGDEMARVVWSLIEEQLILPFLDVPIVSYDLSIQQRDSSNDSVTHEAARAIAQHNVGIKCATITANMDRKQEFGLKSLHPSPNGTIRNALNGTVFREPIVCPGITGPIPAWKKPIVIARHAYADQYRAQEIRVEKAARSQLTITEQANTHTQTLHDHPGPGVAMAMYNDDASIMNFARTCFCYALERKLDVYFATKDTIMKTYDGQFRTLFQHVYDNEFVLPFSDAGLNYHYRLIDDMVAMAVRSSGGFLWACKNYDGDVMSDLVAQGFGSLGMMTSVLLTADGKTMESEAAHGTVTRHFRMHQKGMETSTNPIASIFAWSRGLAFRAKLDENTPLQQFCQRLETTCLELLEEGIMTKDLALLKGPSQRWLTTREFIDAIATRLAHA